MSSDWCADHMLGSFNHFRGKNHPCWEFNLFIFCYSIDIKKQSYIWLKLVVHFKQQSGRMKSVKGDNFVKFVR